MNGVAATPLRRKSDRIDVVSITPEMAQKLLEHNNHNRPVNDRHVGRIVNQIKSGKWIFNGDTIKISDDGDVVDGQHRLWAIIMAETAVPSAIVYGVPREAFATVDTLRKPRSGADVLALNGVSRHRSVLASAMTWLLRWERSAVQDYLAPANRIENSDIESGLAEHPGLAHAVERCMALRGLGNVALVAMFYYVLAEKNEKLAERLISTLLDPAGVSLEDPFYRLRAYFTADHHKHKNPIMTIALMIKATNVAKRANKLSALAWRSQGRNPEAFPTLEA